MLANGPPSFKTGFRMLANGPPALKQVVACLRTFPAALKQVVACLRIFRHILKQAFAKTRIAALLYKFIFNSYLHAKRPKGVIFSVNIRNKNLENKCFYQKLVVLDPYLLIFFWIR